MAAARQDGRLQIDRDMRFQRQSWQIQRICWVLMALFLVAGSIGLFGSGWLAHTQLATADRSLQLEYDRFIRLHAPARLQIRAVSPTARDLQIRISREYLEQFQIAQILPEPERTSAEPESYLYQFLTSSSDRVASALPNRPVAISIDMQADRLGWIDGKISLTPNDELQFKQWVYP
jgi:hypothetical protein